MGKPGSRCPAGLLENAAPASQQAENKCTETPVRTRGGVRKIRSGPMALGRDAQMPARAPGCGSAAGAGTRQGSMGAQPPTGALDAVGGFGDNRRWTGSRPERWAFMMMMRAVVLFVVCGSLA